MREQETLRYLGIHGKQADKQTLALVAECFQELEQAVSPRHIWREYPLTIAGTQIDMSCLVTVSRHLSKNLAGCERILLFAATLGSQADILLKKYTALQMSKAVVMQAAAAAMLEEYCDEQNQKLKEQYWQKGCYLRPRFSPGYGDFPLECQRQIAAALELYKRIGITLTDSLLMAPTKSVTAVIGISRLPGDCIISGCEACGKTSCLYRRSS